jgi:predicted GNAT family acetyltransferase
MERFDGDDNDERTRPLAGKGGTIGAISGGRARMMSAQHPLDRVIWSALTTQHAALAEGDDLARRYPHDIGPFAATRSDDPRSLGALGPLIPVGETIALFTTEDVTPPAPLQVTLRESLDQMVGPRTVAPGCNGAIETLGCSDVAEMAALVEMTRPGPFRPRTHELGRYIGVRCQGRLVAMAGERMHLDGFTELSAVCVHPEHRGKGYAAELLATLSHRIAARSETPFLHVFSKNESAIALYRKLGFTLRRAIRLAVVRRGD